MPTKQRKNGSSWLTAPLNPEIKRGILAVFLFILAILSGVSFFGLGGILGRFINDFFSLLFGVVKYMMPILLVVWAILIEREDAEEHRPTHIIGVILMTLAVTGLIHLFLGREDLLQTALLGQGGGMAGLVFSYPLMYAFDFWVSFIILIALPIIALLFLFNTSLSRIADVYMGFLRGIRALVLGIIHAIGAIFQVERLRVFGAYEQTDAQPEFSQKKLGESEEVEEVPEDDPEKIEEEERTTEDENEEEETSAKPILKKNPFKVLSTRGVPPSTILTSNSGKPTAGDIKANAQIIKDTLMQFGIEVDLGDVRVGPTVTQYTVKPVRGVKLSRITALSNDLALELAAHPIRIEAPIPGQSYVGIEVPNQRIAMVTLKELLESEVFRTREHNMMVALGKDVAGHAWFAELTKMPHLLVAGATGSGKTVCLNTIILSLLFQNTPETLRFIFVDPKRVELTLFNGIPHLLTPVITDVKKTINALRWTISEMERRFDLLAAARKRDIDSFNASAKEKLPYLVFVVDELADLMTTSPKEVEAGIVRLAQMARAVGIHLIIATQRPSVDVITGLIKANVPGRIAFSVASLVDSRTILDMSGAEKLLGRGDMLFLSPSLSKPKRIQGAFVSENEMKAVSGFLKEDEPPAYDLSIAEKGPTSASGTTIFGNTDDRDSHFVEARELIVREGKASASFLQRRLKLGYARAARVLDELEEAGVIGPSDGAKPREILITEREIATMGDGAPSSFDSAPYSSSLDEAEPPIEEEEEPAYADTDDERDTKRV